MNSAPLLIGVLHNYQEYLDEVKRYLTPKKIIEKKVMLELARNRVPSQPQGFEFFRRMGEYIIESGGTVIYGDDEEILERAYARIAELCQKMKDPSLSILEWAELDCENRYDVPHRERDPHFLKVATEQHPDIIILGRNHLPFLIKRHYLSLSNNVRYIPEKR